MNSIIKIDRLLEWMEKGLVVALFSLLALMILFNVVARNVFHVSFQIILEFSPSIVLWLALIGSSLALKENRHIKIEILLRFVSRSFQRYAHALTAVFGMIITGVLFYASFEFVFNEISIFGWKGGITIIFPWFFIASFFRFFLKFLETCFHRPGNADIQAKV